MGWNLNEGGIFAVSQIQALLKGRTSSCVPRERPILTSLIEKSPDAKILRAVVKIVEEWVKNNSPMAANQVSWEEGLHVGQVTFLCR